MISLQKVTSVIAYILPIFPTVLASRFLVVTLIVKDVQVVQKENAVVTKVGMVTAEGMTESNEKNGIGFFVKRL